MEQNKKYILLAVIALVFVAISFFRPPKKPEELAAYETVNFCGTEYQARPIIINGVNVIKRIAEVATNETSQETCDDIKSIDHQNLKFDSTEGLDITSLHLNGYLFDIDHKRKVIMRPGEHGIEDWAKLK